MNFVWNFKYEIMTIILVIYTVTIQYPYNINLYEINYRYPILFHNKPNNINLHHAHDYDCYKR